MNPSEPLTWTTFSAPATAEKSSALIPRLLSRELRAVFRQLSTALSFSSFLTSVSWERKVLFSQAQNSASRRRPSCVYLQATSFALSVSL